MDDLCTDDILQLWQKHHGRLDAKWKFRFFDHPAIDQLKTFSEGELDNGLMYDANLSSVLEKLLRAKANFRSVDDSDWETPKDYSKTPTRKIDQNIDRDRNNEVNESAYKTRAWNRDRNRNRNRNWDKDAESDVSDSPFETL